MTQSLEPTIAVFLDTNHSYLAMLEPDTKGLSLAYINSTTRGIDFSADTPSDDVMQELGEVMLEIAGAATNLTVAVPMSLYSTFSFPAPPQMSMEYLKQLAELEIQHQLEADPNDYVIRLYPMAPRLDETRMVLALAMKSSVKDIIEAAMMPLGVPVARIEPAQFAAHTCFSYNFPFEMEKVVMMVGLREGYADITAISKMNIAYSTSVPIQDLSLLKPVLEEQIAKILEEFLPFIDDVYCFGSHLTKAAMDGLGELSVPAHRLNSFRLITTTLGERERSYCGRVTHILPPCLGSAFPELHESRLAE